MTAGAEAAPVLADAFVRGAARRAKETDIMAVMAPALARPRKTVDDLHALPEGVLAELIDGEIYVNPTPFVPHQVVVGRLHLLLAAHLRDRGTLLLSPMDVHLPSGDVVEPDLLWISPERTEILGRWVHGAPDLAIEVVSATHPERDRIVKRGLYARNGVREYWLVDLEAKGVEVLRLADAAYEPAGWFPSGSSLVSPLLPGLSIPIEPLLSDVRLRS